MTLQEFLDHKPQASRAPLLDIDFRGGEIEGYFVDNVVWTYGPPGASVSLVCDRLYFHAPSIKRPSREEDRRLEFFLYADGNVRLVLEKRDTTLEADSVYYDHARRVAVAENARVVTTFVAVGGLLKSMESRDLRGTRQGRGRPGLEASPLVFTAEVLEAFDFRRFRGRGVVVTTCDFGAPHWGINARTIEVNPVAEAESDSAADQRNFLIDLSSPGLEVAGHTVLPLPSIHWDTRWQDYFPIRSVDFGNESKFGTVAGVEWNVNFFLRQLPLDGVPPVARVLRDSRLGFETVYMAKRGFGYGPLADYGTSPSKWQPWPRQLEAWTYYGEGRYFRIDDHGVDRSNFDRPPPDEERFWGTVLHRQSIPHVGVLDVEWSEYSDAFFLPEFFEEIDKREKEQESLVFLRRNFRDNMAATALFKYRANDFEQEVERLPEGELRMFEQPVFDTGLYTDLHLQAANLRLRPPDGAPAASRRSGRFDVLNEWAYPVHHFDPYVDARPMFFMRYTGYEELLDPARGAEDRASFGSGVTLSQQWGRIFDLDEDSLWNRWFDIRKLKHAISPKVGYFNLFSNDLDPDETLGIDAVDGVDLDEVVSVSLRQSLIVRREEPAAGRVPTVLGERLTELELREYTTRSILDSEVSFEYFPRPGRDNAGDDLSLLVLDNTLRPGSRLALRARLSLDPNDEFTVERLDGSMRVHWLPGVFSTTIRDRLSRRSGVNVVSGLASIYLGDKWEAQAYYARDTERGEDVEYSFAFVRVFHRFALMLEYSIDVGEDRNQTISANFAPLELIGSHRQGPGRRW